jgi:hypothetical protein
MRNAAELREWYKHLIYAPGMLTGVPTLTPTVESRID